jgi:DNA-binding response OmpR family regulator
MRQLRARLAPAPLVVIAISASPQMKSASLSSGCDDFLAKPIRIDHLIHCLGQHLGVGMGIDRRRWCVGKPARRNMRSRICLTFSPGGLHIRCVAVRPCMLTDCFLRS